MTMKSRLAGAVLAPTFALALWAVWGRQLSRNHL